MTTRARTTRTTTTQDDLDQVIEIMKSLGDPVRWALLCRIAGGGEVGLAELSNGLPLTKSTLSYHVRLLREARLITVRKAGRHRFVALRPKAFDLVARVVQDRLLVDAPPALELTA